MVNYKGCTCAQLTGLKRKLAPTGAKFAVVKNSLAKRAVENTAMSSVAELFKGSTAVVWASVDPVQPAKLITEFAKDKETFQVLGGAMEGKALDPAQIEALAKLPSKNEILANLLSIMNAPAVRLLQTINAPAASLARLLGAWRDEIEKKGQ